MTDGAYTRLNESWETIRWDNGEGSADWQALRTLLDAYQRAVEALEHELLGAREQVLDEARKMGVPDASRARTRSAIAYPAMRRRMKC